LNSNEERRLPAGEAKEREFAEANRDNAWRELFGVEAPLWEDEQDAPQIDENELRGFARGELPREDEKRILNLSLRFWSWAKAVTRVCSEEFRDSKQ
jgi:hypothetical protein